MFVSEKKHYSQCYRGGVCCFSFVLKASSFESQPLKSVALTQCFGFTFSQLTVSFNRAEKTIYHLFLGSSIPWSSWTFKGRPQKCNCDQSWPIVDHSMLPPSLIILFFENVQSTCPVLLQGGFFKLDVSKSIEKHISSATHTECMVLSHDSKTEGNQRV